MELRSVAASPTLKMTDMRQCIDCRWFVTAGTAGMIGNGEQGLCRCFPVWVYVLPTHGCGQWQWSKRDSAGSAQGSGMRE